MEDLRGELVDLLGTLRDEELVMVLAYARCVRDGVVPSVPSLEELVEEGA